MASSFQDKKLNPQKYILDTSQKILFIRHGQTICNSDKNYNTRKFNPDYIDSHLSENGKKQCLKLQSILEKFNIEAIYVSPLYRSLETVKYMVENLNYKGEIIVHPLITECPNFIDDFIFDINQTKEDFRELKINWNIFDESIKQYNKWEQNFFYFEFFNKLDEKIKNIKYNKMLDLYKNENLNELKKEIVEEIVKNIFKEEKNIKPFESFKHVYERFLEFKNFLMNKYKDSMNDLNKKIIVITHGDFLRVITNKYLYNNDDENFFPKDCYHYKNCDIISILT
jgi:broad specificity phosphatase PhoE